VVNLETSVTLSDAYETKGINYRVSPKNTRCLHSFAIDCCTLANNHVLDWGQDGLTDTLQTLQALGISATGAGRNLEEARCPAVINLPSGGRVIVFSFALPSSGVPRRWAAGPELPGVNFLPDLSDTSLALVRASIEDTRRSGDVVILSLHWGPNWGYEISNEQRAFARGAIDSAYASIVHGHSSHHAKGIEVYKERLILYGCGDFLNDYEGIEGFEEYRGDLSVMYFADVHAGGELITLELVPLQIRRLQLALASPSDVEWLGHTLDRESAPMGVRVSKDAAGTLVASWTKSGEAA
jgi:poly-gamma-glutamate synthesis protein (capsule biosynthesis protein)